MNIDKEASGIFYGNTVLGCPLPLWLFTLGSTTILSIYWKGSQEDSNPIRNLRETEEGLDELWLGNYDV